jgi:lipopolysaccharide biosynthesis protein
MKRFKNPIHKKEFTNKFYEKMTMVMTRNSTIWIHHEDCNEDFEKLGETFNYILDSDEVNAINDFIDECETICIKMIEELSNNCE